MFVPTGKSSEESISAFEREIQFRLPDDYRAFLRDTNGGVCQHALIRPQRPGELLIDCLFGLGVKDEMDLRFWYNEMKGDVPEKSLIIGSDAGGGFLLLSIETNLEGIYYYDHSYSFPTSTDNENTYLIYPSFSELFSQILQHGKV